MTARELSLPIIPPRKITPEVLKKVEALMQWIGSSDAIATEEEIEKSAGIPQSTQRLYKTELRKLFGLPARSDLSQLLSDPLLRSAIESIVVRAERSDKNTLRSARQLSVVFPNTCEVASVEAYLKSLYAREGVNATGAYRALRARCLKKQVLKESNAQAGAGLIQTPSLSPAALEDLPSEASVIRFLRKFREASVSVRRGRSRKHDWEKEQEAFVTRDVTQYRPGELWIGDHTELDFIVLNEKGRLDRRWITCFIDIRTGLITGHDLNWQPTSQTIAMAFRAGVLGLQLKAFTGERYEPIRLLNVPETVMIDNGKDYQSNQTKRLFGKIDFEDSARLSIQRMTRLHYVLPYHGQSKAQMERWFRTIQTMLKYLPGFKGNQYQNKPDSLSSDLKCGNILSVGQFDALVAVAINAYNNRIHRTLKNQTPLQCYLTNQTHQRTIDPRVLDFLMMKAANKVIRKCQVRFLGGEYYSDALLPFNGKRADLYYDPLDLGFGSIYVQGEFAAVASNKDMIGKDERGWLTILRARKSSEHLMQEELKAHRLGISDAEARVMLLEGELLNTSPVSNELMNKKVPTLTLLTGVEGDAKRVDEEMEKESEMIEIQRAAKKRAKQSPLSLANIERSIR